MKYELGDMVKVRMPELKFGVIIRTGILFEKPLYTVIVQGYPGKQYFVYEDQIEDDIE